MVRDTANSISTIVEQVNDTPSTLQIEILYPNELEMLQMQQPILIPFEEFYISTGTGFGNEDLDYYDYDYESESDYFEFDFEEAYEDYVASMNARTHFLDVRKQETIDREKDNTHRQKRRATQLTRKANKANARQKEQDVREKKRPSKKSGRRGSHGHDIVLC